MDCIVIGAGASGLFAARKLASSNNRVQILEARDRIGGRIYTNRPEGFSAPIEAGAEFLHGEVSLTQQLCKEASVQYKPLTGQMYRIENGRLCKDDFFENEWKILLDELETLQHDTPLSNVLDTKFPNPDDQAFKRNIRRFVEGYSAADIEKVSAFALRKEWSDDEGPTQYRPVGGYGTLMNFLKNEIESHNGEIALNAVVESVSWDKQGVVVHTTDGRIYQAQKILVTVPVGILQRSQIRFIPEPPALKIAATNIGFGSVVKIAIQFNQAFWKDGTFRKFHNLDFLFTDAVIPTWWTQSQENNVLTGWFGGPDLEKEFAFSDEDYLRKATTALAYCFDCSAHQVKDMIVSWKVFQWLHDPYAKGAYSYVKPETPDAIQLLMKGFGNTLYFAGEAIYTGKHTGTVEAALKSGQDAADRMMSER